MTDLDGNFDVIIFGTGLVESIVAAALSKAGVKVAHLDNNPYYGGNEASLNLDELASWADSRSTSSENPETVFGYLAAQRNKFFSISRSSLIPDHSRHYSISLAPSLIPSVGPLISSLIASGVSRYGGYRLLERVGIYSSGSGLQNVPGSKEDIFRSSLSLIEKRRLMRFLVFASGEFEGSKELQGYEQTAFPEFLKSKFSLTHEMMDAIVYALAFCSSDTDSTLFALTRLRSYLRSAGRYGASPFLVGHYGGLGEIAQGFCRVSAVNGGVYILDKKAKKITTPSSTSGDKFVVQLDDIPEPLTADVLVTAPDQIFESLHLPQVQDTPSSLLARCIAIIDKPIPFPPFLSSGDGSSEGETEWASTTGDEDADEPSLVPGAPSGAHVEAPPIDTSVIIFPPSSVNGGSSTKAAQAFITGAGTLSAPQGKYVVYLSVPILDDEDPEPLIEPYLGAILSLAYASEPLFKLTYAQRVSFPPSSTTDQSSISVSPAPPPHLAEISDFASSAAETLYFRIIDILKLRSPQAWTTESSGGASEGGDVFSELKVPMWPPLESSREDEGGEE
ncbi:GDP dissociation inhibitor-domain-containing protein [Multifurca ochricompacta]|uniref:GDP dissociation inhibitor-domain-containing protein n=1 Tax=Multifurca ochricompacta TaxID=376703 RepID=A0AAD4M5B6_9AGAM|nr:GDP dissociation inhibitor-domain-containing protein [Multifurca ochricompacta]